MGDTGEGRLLEGSEVRTGNYPEAYADVGIWVETQVIVRTRVINTQICGDDHGYPRFKDTVVQTIDNTLSKTRTKVDEVEPR